MDRIKSLEIKLEEALRQNELIRVENEVLRIENASLRQRVKDLEERLAKNSANSSKPPSSDGFNKPKPKNLRGKTGLRPGGQPGHEGRTLPMDDDPKHVVRLAAEFCDCGCDVGDEPVVTEERRQVRDLPEEIKLETTEFRSEVKRCPRCGREVRSVFPPLVTAPVQYGPRVRAAAAYMMNHQLLPFDRTVEFFEDFFNTGISAGTLNNIQTQLAGVVERPFEEIKRLVAAAEVAHFDETGVYVNGGRHWLHVVSTPSATCYFVHERRGAEAINEAGVLPGYHGIAVHDHYSSYYNYDCLHGECGAHILRELKFLLEERERLWAGQMSTLLTETKELVDRAKAEGRTYLDPEILETVELAYDRIVEEALESHPAPEPTPGKRGRPKGTKEWNLLKRLEDFKEEILRFASDFRVPFDNNLAERDLRMMKAKQKISGCFRSESGAHNWSRIRAYISTARKNGMRVLDVLTNAFAGDCLIPIQR